MRPIFSAPTSINLEITDICNTKCRHCYNFWREDNNSSNSLTKERFDRLVEMFVEARVFHVVLTGGEPFTRFDLLEYGLKKLVDNGITISCNSNLGLANPEKIKRLADVGLDHILTSLCSHDAETNDYMVHQKGAHGRIVRGIEAAVKGGIRVSVNMVVSQRNKDHVYDTAKFVHELGCQKIFGTRTVPSVNLTSANGTEFEITKEDALHTLDQLIRAKQETGIMICTLVSYPLCLLGDLDRYKDFVGRGCPAQSGHVMSINSNGQVHACPHQSESYGDIFQDGIPAVFQRMREWHDGSYHYEGCNGCDYLDICQTGCRMSANGYYGKMTERDQLFVGKEGILKPYKIVHDQSIYNKINQGQLFTVPKRLRFRKEDGFYLVNVRWANTVTCETDIAEFLKEYQATGEPFSVEEFGHNRRELLAKLFFKDIIEAQDLAYSDDRSRIGLSGDILAAI